MKKHPNPHIQKIMDLVDDLTAAQIHLHILGDAETKDTGPYPEYTEQSKVVMDCALAIIKKLEEQEVEYNKMKDTLVFVERWANHHGTKPHTTPQEALSVIQHHPVIAKITKGYTDGVIPSTFDPYARIAVLESALKDLVVESTKFATQQLKMNEISVLLERTFGKET